MRQTVKCILLGIAWGCTWLVAAGVVLALWAPEVMPQFMESYPWQALGAAAVGVACTLPARLYATRRLPPAWRFVIHCAVGLGVYFPVAFSLGWIPFQPSQPGITVLEILIGLGIFLAIWYIFFLINRREARRINERVRELRRENSESAGNKVPGGQRR